MTSICKHKNGGCYAQILLPHGVRVMLWLGKPNKTQIAIIKHNLDVLVSAKKLNIQPAPEILKWAMGLDKRLKAKLAEFGLLDTPENWNVDAWFEHCIKMVINRSDRTVNSYELSRGHLVKSFGDMPLTKLTATHCKQAAEKLLSRYAETHVAKLIGHGRMWINIAIDSKLLTENPFDGIKIGRAIDKSRQRYIPPITILNLLQHCPNTESRTILSLARFAGLRCPHEMLALKWKDIDWDAGRFRIDENTKTGYRLCPLFPEVREALNAQWEEAYEGSVYVIERSRNSAGTNWREWIEAAVQSAKIEQWPKLFVNLRASCRTDLRKRFPEQAVNAWLGHGSKVAAMHYELLTSEDWERAAHCNFSERTVMRTVTDKAGVDNTGTQNNKKT